MAIGTGTKKFLNTIQWDIIGYNTTVDKDGNSTNTVFVQLFPTLTMDINPSEMTTSYKQTITRTRTIGGFVEEHWPESLDSISASGRTAMFYNMPTIGLTVLSANDSIAHQNFYKLVTMYKNNGRIYDSKTEKLYGVGRVRMFFNEKIYEGHFTSFNTKDTSDSPFTLDYDFVFEIERTIGEMVIAPPNLS